MTADPWLTSVAERCDVSLAELKRAIGASWERYEDKDPELTCGAVLVGSGEPLQVLIAQGMSGEVTVHQPVGRWRGQELVIEEGRNHLEDWDYRLETLAAAVDRATKAQRKSCFWCRSCRTLTSPWHRFEKDLCHGCATEVLGVVY